MELVMKDQSVRQKNVVSQDRWSLVTGSITLKCESFCQEYTILQVRWSLITMVSQDRFQCITSIKVFLVMPGHIVQIQ